MASAPPEPPESIILGAFTGVRNNVSPERLREGELETAINVDVDDVGQLRRRRGYARKMLGDFHSVQTVNRGVLAVRDGSLGWILPGYAFVALRPDVGPQRISAAQVGPDVYYSSMISAGVIRADDTVESWAVPASAPAWLSPVRNPTDTLGEVAGKLVSPPPTGSDIAVYRGRLYIAHEKVLWFTELYLYGLVDRTKGYIQFEAPITLVMAVTDGLYVGTTEGLFFLQGNIAQGMKLVPIVSAGVIPGSGAFVPTSRVHPQARQGPVAENEAAVFLTAAGVCAGMDGGQVFNLTQERFVPPGMVSAAVLYRELDGVTQLIAVADSAGAPTATARIGDYVDAEIRRFQGG